jgi:hypothetical protein
VQVSEILTSTSTSSWFIREFITRLVKVDILCTGIFHKLYQNNGITCLLMTISWMDISVDKFCTIYFWYATKWVLYELNKCHTMNCCWNSWLLHCKTSRGCLAIIQETREKLMSYMNSAITWNVILCSLVEVHHNFGGIYCLHLQGHRESQACNEQETGSKNPVFWISYLCVMAVYYYL